MIWIPYVYLAMKRNPKENRAYSKNLAFLLKQEYKDNIDI